MDKDNRSYQRINIRLPVQVTLSDGTTVGVYSANLSAGGIAILHEMVSDKGTSLSLSFVIPSDGDSRSIRVVAEVVHHYFSSALDNFVIGMRFEQASDEDRLAVDCFVRSVDRIRGL